MSIADTFNWRSGLSVLSARLSGRHTDGNVQCICLCEPPRAWSENAPGKTAIFTPGGEQLWCPPISETSAEVEFLSDDFLDQLDCSSRKQFLECLEVVGSGENSDLKLFPVKLSGCETEETFPFIAHFSRLPSCGAETCLPKIVVTLLETSGPSNALPVEGSSNFAQQGGVLELQSRVNVFGSKPPFASSENNQSRQVRLDLAEALQAEAGSLQTTFEFAGIDFSLEKPEDMPAIFHDPRDLSRLVRRLFEVAESMGGIQPGIRVVLKRLASSVKIQASMYQMIARDNSSHEPDVAALQRLEETARRTGKFKQLAGEDHEFRLQLTIPINASMIAPEPAEGEERIVRLPRAANRNANPMPRGQKTG